MAHVGPGIGSCEGDMQLHQEFAERSRWSEWKTISTFGFNGQQWCRYNAHNKFAAATGIINKSPNCQFLCAIS